MTKKTETVKLSELRNLTNAIFDELENLGQSQIYLRHDYYWSFVGQKRYEIEPTPKPSLGQLYDDLEFLRTANTETRLTASHLCNLAGLFNYIGDLGNQVFYEEK